MFYLLEWVKLLYSLNTFYFFFFSPPRNHLRLCFLGNVSYFVGKKSSSQLHCIYMGFRSAYVFVYHTLNSRAPFTFQHWAAPAHSDVPSPAPQMLMQGCHLGLGDVGHEGLKVDLNFSRMFCIAVTYSRVWEVSAIVSCHLVDFQKCSHCLSLLKARPHLIFIASF